MNIFNSKELKLSIETLANIQDLEKEDVVKILEDVFSVSVRQSFNKENVIKAKINSDYKVDLFLKYKVVDDNHSVLSEGEKFSNYKHLYEDQAEEKFGVSYSAGDEILEEIKDFEYSRFNVSVAKQQIKTKMKEFQNNNIRNKFLSKDDELVNVVVKGYDKNGYTVEYLGEFLGYIPKSNLFNNERLLVGKSYHVLFDFSDENKNSKHSLIFSRKGEKFVESIITKEIPDIYNEIISIKDLYLDFSARKIVMAVHSSDKNTDVIGSCVGLKGTRINNVMDHFYGTSVDVVEWKGDKIEFINSIIKNAIFLVDDEKCFIVVLKDEDFKSFKFYKAKAISKFTGLKIKVLSESSYNSTIEDKINYFKEELLLDEDSSKIIVESGFSSIDEIKEYSVEEISEIMDLDEESAMYICDIVDKKIKERDKTLEKVKTNLYDIERLDNFLIDKLITSEINDIESLSDLDVYELMDILPISKDEAGKIIIESRNF